MPDLHLSGRQLPPALAAPLCADCAQPIPDFPFYTDGVTLAPATFMARNASQTWQKTLCHRCWAELRNRSFSSVKREGDSFILTTCF